MAIEETHGATGAPADQFAQALTPGRWPDVSRTVDAALELPPAERAAFIERACAGDAELRPHVERLLAACERAENAPDFLAESAAAFAAPVLTELAARDAGAQVSLPAALAAKLAAALPERYTIEREVGRGGMAVVYLAQDVRHGRPVAIKVLRPELARELGAERFLREIRRTAQLHHPHIVQLLDSGEAGGLLYYVMPYTEGGTLRQRLAREKQLPIAESVSIARTVAEALDHAHHQGLIHRDVKPENILFTEGEACLADFGIARATERAVDESSTSAGIVRGTLAYMSPEQASGARDYDARSDVFSLGCVVYEMLAGVPAFVGPTPEAVLAQRLVHAPRDLRVYRPSVSAALEAVVRKALELAPADRFWTAGEFAAALDRAGGPESRPRQLVAAAGRWVRARPSAAALATIAALIGGVLLLRATIDPPLRLGERDWILVADFQGPSDEPTVAPAVRELVTAELNQSRVAGTVTRQQLNAVMRLAGVAETTHVDAKLARQLAFRSAVRAIVVGSVQPIGDNRYSVAVHLVRADDGRDLRSVATAATEQELVSAIGGAVRELRRYLGEHRKAIEATLPLREAATPSFRAYQKYVEAAIRAQRGNPAGSTALLREAIAIDPQFASAWALMGVNYFAAQQLDSAQLAFGRALAMPGRLTVAQQYRLRGDVAYTIDYDIPAAIKWYGLYLAEYPRSVGGRSNRALYRSAVGDYEGAVADLRDAIRANPFGPAQAQTSVFNLAVMLVSLGRVDEAQLVARDLQPPFLPAAELVIAVARGRWDEVASLSAAVEANAKGPALVRLLGTTGHASALAARGSSAAAARVLDSARNATTGSAARWYDRSAVLLALAAGLKPASPAPGGGPDTSLAGALTRALRAAAAGDTMAARREFAFVAAARPNERALLGHGPALVQARIAAAGGRWREVTGALAGASLVGEHDATVPDRVSSLEIRWLVATAYAAQGQLDSAVLHMERAIAPERVPPGHLALRGLVWPAANQKLAEWSAARGDRNTGVRP